LVFCQPTGRPIDPRADWASWKALLADAGVRDARLHDARHTAATLLLVQGVNARTVMDIMGWTEARMLALPARRRRAPSRRRQPDGSGALAGP
jgi:integrase